MIVRLLLLLLAICIDAIQGFMSVALFIFTLVPGTATGALTGCVVGSYAMGSCQVGAFILGILGSFFNAGAAATVPIGILIAMVLSVSFSLIFGAALVLFLVFARMFYPGSVVAAVTLEVLPGLNLFPTWTALVLRSMHNKNKEETQERETREAYA